MSPRAALLIASVLTLAGCSFDVPQEPVGSFEVSWVLRIDDRSGQCEDAGADAVRVTYEAQNAPYRFRDTFPCELEAAEASFLPLDQYQVSTRLLDADGRLIERGSPMEVALTAGAVTVLPTVTFRVETAPRLER